MIKIADIASELRVDSYDIYKFVALVHPGEYKYKSKASGAEVSDDDADRLKRDFIRENKDYFDRRESIEEQTRILEEQARIQREKREKEIQDLINFEAEAKDKVSVEMGCSGFGRKIVKSFGYISADAAVTVLNKYLYISSPKYENIQNTLSKTRESAVDQLKTKAYKLGCNAILGLKIDQIQLSKALESGLNEEMTVICITASGDAVILAE